MKIKMKNENEKIKKAMGELMRIEPEIPATSPHIQPPTSPSHLQAATYNLQLATSILQLPTSCPIIHHPSHITHHTSYITYIHPTQSITRSLYAPCCSIELLPDGTHTVHT
jgi:hypothetical protein